MKVRILGCGSSFGVPLIGNKFGKCDPNNDKNFRTRPSILISHNHYDHLDTKTLLKIKNKRDITVICPLKLSKIIYNLGYKNVIELDWHERKQILDFTFLEYIFPNPLTNV